MSLESVRAFMADRAPDIEIVELEMDSTTMAMSSAWGVKPAQVAKTLSVRAGDRALLLVTCGDSRLDNKKAKTALGGRVKMLSAEEAQALTGTRPANDQPLGGGSFFLVKLAPDGAILYGKSFAPAVVSDATFPYGLAFANDGSLRAAGFLQGSVSYDGKAPLSSEAFTANAIVLAFGP